MPRRFGVIAALAPHDREARVHASHLNRRCPPLDPCGDARVDRADTARADHEECADRLRRQFLRRAPVEGEKRVQVVAPPQGVRQQQRAITVGDLDAPERVLHGRCQRQRRRQRAQAEALLRRQTPCDLHDAGRVGGEGRRQSSHHVRRTVQPARVEVVEQELHDCRRDDMIVARYRRRNADPPGPSEVIPADPRVSNG